MQSHDDEDDDDDDDDNDEDSDEGSDDHDSEDDDSDYPCPIILPGEEPECAPFGSYPWEKRMLRTGYGRRETAPEHDSRSESEVSYPKRFYRRNWTKKFQLRVPGAEVVKVFSYWNKDCEYLIWGRVKEKNDPEQEFKDTIMWVKYADFPCTTTRHAAKGVKLEAIKANETREKEEGLLMTRELMEEQAKAWMAVEIAKKHWKKQRRELNLHGISPMKRHKKEGKYFIIH